MRSSAAKILVGFLSSSAIWFAAVRGQDPAPPAPRVDVTVDLFQLVDRLNNTMAKGQDIPVDQVVGIEDRIRAIVDDSVITRTRPATVTAPMTFSGPGLIRANARRKDGILFDPGADLGPNWYSGVAWAVPGANDVAGLLMTSPSYGVDDTHQIKGLGPNTLALRVPAGCSIALVQGTHGPAGILCDPKGTTHILGKLVVGQVVGAKSLVSLRWTIPAASLRSGNGNAAGAELLPPFKGQALSVSAVYHHPEGKPLPPGGDVVLDVNIEGKSLWATTPDRRPKLNAAGPAGSWSTSPFNVPTYPEAKAGGVVTVDVDNAPAGVPAGAEVRVMAWFLVEQP